MIKWINFNSNFNFFVFTITSNIIIIIKLLLKGEFSLNLSMMELLGP